MSKKQRDRLFAKISRSIKNVTFDELVKLFEMFGFEIEPPRRGSHCKIRLNAYRMTLPRPHGKHVDEVYVKRAISIFEKIMENEE